MPRPKGSRNLHILHRFRAKAGLSQSQLADLAGISVREVSRLENGYGKYNASVITVGKLANALQIEPEDLAELLDQKEVSDRTKRRIKQRAREKNHEGEQTNDDKADKLPDNSDSSPANSLLQLVA